MRKNDVVFVAFCDGKSDPSASCRLANVLRDNLELNTRILNQRTVRKKIKDAEEIVALLNNCELEQNEWQEGYFRSSDAPLWAKSATICIFLGRHTDKAIHRTAREIAERFQQALNTGQAKNHKVGNGKPDRVRRENHLPAACKIRHPSRTPWRFALKS